jgi:hypothetical protein
MNGLLLSARSGFVVMGPGVVELSISWVVGGQQNELNRLFGTGLMNGNAGLETLEQIELMMLHRLVTLTKSEVQYIC